MESILDKNFVLNLNASWQKIGWRTVRQSIISLCGGDSEHPALALDIELDDDGKLIRATPTVWEDWIKLEVRSSDLAITTAKGTIRCPTIIVSRNFKEMPVKRPRLSKKAILERDGYVCQYSGEKLHPSQLNVDHVTPRDKGGKDEWENLVACRKEINTKKGNKFNHEAGLKLKKKPNAPRAAPVSFFIREARRPEQEAFFAKG